jgi:small subunit ribosomal protein S17
MEGQRRKVRVGTVIGHKMNKTAVVAVERRALDKTFKKYLKRMNKFKVHDEKNESKVGDRVQIVETRPISKEKRWRLQKILVKGESVEPGIL